MTRRQSLTDHAHGTGPLAGVALWLLAAGATSWSDVARHLGVSRQYIGQRLAMTPAADTRVGDLQWWSSVTNGSPSDPDAWTQARARLAGMMASTYDDRRRAVSASSRAVSEYVRLDPDRVPEAAIPYRCRVRVGDPVLAPPRARQARVAGVIVAFGAVSDLGDPVVAYILPADSDREFVANLYHIRLATVTP